MAVKHLNDYFDFKKFMAGKKLEVTECKSHYIYVDGKKSDNTDGTSLTVVISEDRQKNNRFSTFKIIVLGTKLDLDPDNEDYIVQFTNLDGIETSIYGNFHNELSVKVGINNIKLGRVHTDEN